VKTDVIGGVNSFIDEQKKLPDPASIAFVRFDSEATERFRPMQALAECKPLTNDDYKPRGGTPLLDALVRPSRSWTKTGKPSNRNGPSL